MFVVNFVDETQSIASGYSSETTRHSRGVEYSPVDSQTTPQSDVTECDSSQLRNRPASVASPISLRPPALPLSQHPDGQNKADHRGSIGPLLNRIHESSGLFSSWSPDSSTGPGQGTFRPNPDERVSITRHESDLLHHFRLHVGWIWVCAIMAIYAKFISCSLANMTYYNRSSTLLIRASPPRSFVLRLPPNFYCTPCWQ